MTTEELPVKRDERFSVDSQSILEFVALCHNCASPGQEEEEKKKKQKKEQKQAFNDAG